jgi:hypothetical protein
MSTIVKDRVVALVAIALHRPVELLIPTDRRQARRRLRHHANTATLRDLVITNDPLRQSMILSDSLAQMCKVGSPNESIPMCGTMSRLQWRHGILLGERNKDGKDQRPAPAIAIGLRRPHRG